MSQEIKDLVEKVIDFENEMGGRFDKKVPFYKKIREKYMNGKRFGLKILDDDGGVLGEYTIVIGEPYIEGYEEGIDDVCMTEGIKKYVIEEMLDDEEAFRKKPWRTFAKYAAKMPKYFKDRDITFEK